MTTATSSASVAACEKRKKIIIKRKPGQQLSKEADNVSIRLLDFNIYDANATESAVNDSNEKQEQEQFQYQHSNNYKKKIYGLF